MREVPLPNGFEGLAGQVRFVHRATASEYASSCPKCGGDLHHDGSWPDRFRMFVVGKYRGWCRKCGYIWFPDMADPNFKPDPVLLAQWQAERERQYTVQKEIAERALEVLDREKRWLEWHEHLTDDTRRMWERAGIPRDWQDFWKLGFTEDKRFEVDGQNVTLPSLTIPKFDFGWKCKNIDFRLINPPSGFGRYRPLANLPPVAYNTTPHLSGYGDEVYVVEGSKKAMVVSIRTGGELKQAIGLPSCCSWAGMDTLLRDCGRVWIIFDPDATKWAHKFAQSIGKGARIVELPCKPDDAILYYGMNEKAFQQSLHQATRVNL